MSDSENSKTTSARQKPRKGGLGRGLGSLIPTSPVQHTSHATQSVPAENSLQEVDVNKIQPNPWQPRLHMEPEQLRELAGSIGTHGLMQPLVVAESETAGLYTLIAGERRWRASQLAGLKQVPVVVMTATPQEMLELAIVENVVRADLSPLEEAHAYRKLIEDFNLTQGEVAERVGKSRVAITNTLRLLNAPEQVQQAIVDGDITEGHARALLGLTSITDQLALLDDVRSKSLNVRQTENLVRGWAKKPAQKELDRPTIDAELIRIESRLRDALGTRVALKRSDNGGGKIEIEFGSEEHLQSIYNRLVEEELW